MAEHNKIRVIITNKQKAVKIPTGIRMLVRRCCNAVLRLEKFEGSAEISVTFTDNEGIKALNKQYRDKDIETDVLLSQWAKTVFMTPIPKQAHRFSVML